MDSVCLERNPWHRTLPRGRSPGRRHHAGVCARWPCCHCQSDDRPPSSLTRKIAAVKSAGAARPRCRRLAVLSLSARRPPPAKLTSKNRGGEARGAPPPGETAPPPPPAPHARRDRPARPVDRAAAGPGRFPPKLGLTGRRVG